MNDSLKPLCTSGPDAELSVVSTINTDLTKQYIEKQTEISNRVAELMSAESAPSIVPYDWLDDLDPEAADRTRIVAMPPELLTVLINKALSEPFALNDEPFDQNAVLVIPRDYRLNQLDFEQELNSPRQQD